MGTAQWRRAAASGATTRGCTADCCASHEQSAAIDGALTARIAVECGSAKGSMSLVEALHRAACCGDWRRDFRLDAHDCCSRATRVRYWCRTRAAVVPLMFEPTFVLSGSLIITLCSLFCYLVEWVLNYFHSSKTHHY